MVAEPDSWSWPACHHQHPTTTTMTPHILLHLRWFHQSPIHRASIFINGVLTNSQIIFGFILRHRHQGQFEENIVLEALVPASAEVRHQAAPPHLASGASPLEAFLPSTATSRQVATPAAIATTAAAGAATTTSTSSRHNCAAAATTAAASPTVATTLTTSRGRREEQQTSPALLLHPHQHHNHNNSSSIIIINCINWISSRRSNCINNCWVNNCQVNNTTGCTTSTARLCKSNNNCYNHNI